MPLVTKKAKGSATLPSRDRRLPVGSGLLARWVRALQGWVRRPMGIYRLDGRWRAGLVERRQAPDDAMALRGILDDLQEQLLAQDPSFTSTVLRQLVQVHDEMRVKGWAGVLALPEAVRSKALFQAQILAQRTAYPVLTQLTERLRAAQPGVVQPVLVASPSPQAKVARAASDLEVSETTPEAFEAEASQLGWLDTVPPWQPRTQELQELQEPPESPESPESQKQRPPPP